MYLSYEVDKQSVERKSKGRVLRLYVTKEVYLLRKNKVIERIMGDQLIYIIYII